MIEKIIPEAGSFAMFNKLSKMADEFMRTAKQLREQSSSSKKGNVDSLHFPVPNDPLIPESDPSILLHRKVGVKL